jgi:hypothetical protein
MGEPPNGSMRPYGSERPAIRLHHRLAQKKPIDRRPTIDSYYRSYYWPRTASEAPPRRRRLGLAHIAYADPAYL